MSAPRMSLSVVVMLALMTVGSCQVCTTDTCSYDGQQLDCSDRQCTQYFFNESLPIKHINLRGNQLTTVTSLTVFCSSLVTVDLSFNDVISMSRDAFTDCNQLEIIDLTANRLKLDEFQKVPTDSPIYALRQLKQLLLGSNRLGADITNQPFHGESITLERLNLSRNGISFIDANSLSDEQLLQVLDLSHNSLQSVGSMMFRGLWALKYLDLSYNKLVVLDADFCIDCTKLAFLDISSNAIHQVDNNAFHHLAGLSVLYMREYRGSSLPESLPASLQHLYVDDSNELLEMSRPDDYIDTSYAANLEIVSVTRCKSLTSIRRRWFAHMKHLRTVNITNNQKLTLLEGDVFGGRSSLVVNLDLSHNSLTSLDINLVNWTALTSLDLSGNNWDCSCQLDWMHHLNINQSALQTVTCQSPLHLQGYTLSDIDIHTNLSCSLKERYRRQGAIAMMVFTTVVFVLVVSIVVVKNKPLLTPTCCSGAGKYETLYSATEAAVDSEEAVQIIKATQGDYQGAAGAGDFKGGPISV